jgi:hypothetical protein
MRLLVLLKRKTIFYTHTSSMLVILDTCTFSFGELIICGLMAMNTVRATHTLSVTC